MRRLIEAQGAARAEAAAERLGAALGAAVPEAEVTVADARVTLTGRGLRTHPALRWPGGLLR